MGYLVNELPISVTNTSHITAIYQQNQLQFGGGVDNNEIDVSIIITIGGPLSTNISYDLVYPNNIAIFVNNGEGCYYDYPNTIEGYLTLTKFDQTNFIVSGNFDFQLRPTIVKKSLLLMEDLIYNTYHNTKNLLK